ncbi:hypothetical protein DVR12_21635 [Chitinophaga silvatica]|uniref:Uncharacterized protein n=1 Tax=Chitinophaga silvatica TaxID=2282649 RepID=A0A3E1Y4T2_9BACT|nr:hypothetical protein [Chitinophaga silvatica]RFS19708.1 hypothetical protein DVR12_21635 [Chitinophaga silvatica]
MIAYNKESLDHLAVRETAANALHQGYIDQSTYDSILTANPVDFYTPGLFARIGIYVLTWMALLFGVGFISLILFSHDFKEEILYPFAFLVGAGCIFLLEMLIREKRIYRAGIDDALLLAGAGAIILSMYFLYKHDDIYLAIVTCLVTIAATIRYADKLMVAAAYTSFLAIIFLLLESRFLAILPFIIMGISLVAYFICKRNAEKFSFRHYRDCFQLTTILALASFYAAGNYYVIQTLSPSGVPIPWLFWGFTVIVPILFIYLGIKKKDVILLRSGLIYIAIAILTIRYFYSVMPLATAMIISGAVLIALAWALIRYLHKPKHGFTYEAVAQPSLADKLNISGLIIAQTFGGGANQQDSGVQFGGGSGGGGGASGEY